MRCTSSFLSFLSYSTRRWCCSALRPHLPCALELFESHTPTKPRQNSETSVLSTHSSCSQPPSWGVQYPRNQMKVSAKSTANNNPRRKTKSSVGSLPTLEKWPLGVIAHGLTNNEFEGSRHASAAPPFSVIPVLWGLAWTARRRVVVGGKNGKPPCI